MILLLINYFKTHLIEISAVFIAIISAFYAYRSSIIASKALKIAKQDFELKQSNFSLYYCDSFRTIVKVDNNAKKLFLFNITLRNSSLSKNTFSASLEIEFVRKDDTVARVLLDHNPNLSNLIQQKDMSFFQTDIRLDEKASETKWLIFEQPSTVFADYRIEKYSIKIKDINNKEQIAQTTLMKKIEYETKKDKS